MGTKSRLRLTQDYILFWKKMEKKNILQLLLLSPLRRDFLFLLLGSCGMQNAEVCGGERVSPNFILLPPHKQAANNKQAAPSSQLQCIIPAATPSQQTEHKKNMK